MNVATFLLVSFIGVAAHATLPTWITSGPTGNTTYAYVVCSHEGIDPEEVKQIAESKCLASAAKLGGVTVTIKQKTVQSLSGSDSGEVAETAPLQKNIKCEWSQRYLEELKAGYRVWLQCRVLKSSISSPSPVGPALANDKTEAPPSSYKRATAYITTAPQGDKIIISGQNGERVIDVTSNVQSVELKEGDRSIEVKKQKYIANKRLIANFKNGDALNMTFYLEPDL